MTKVNKFKTILLIFLCASLAIVVFSCKGNSDNLKPKSLSIDQLISEKGTFLIGDYRIEVDVVNKLIELQIYNDLGEQIFKLQDHASAIHRWFFLFDSENLWFHSSDIGSFVYVQINEGGEKLNIVNDLPAYSIKQIPKSFYNELPESVKKRINPSIKKE